MPTHTPSHPPTPKAAEGTSTSRWYAEMRWRMRHHLVLKVLGVSAFMWVFFMMYFYLLRHPARPVMVMPLTALDRALPFQPSALWAYVSLWLYVGLPPGLMLSLREMCIYGLWIGGLCLTGLGIFYLWPTAVPPPQVAVDLVAHPAFAVLQGVDAAGNACPSLHVATSVFTAFWVHRLLCATQAPRAFLWLNLLWAGLIVYSTVAIRQHVVWDVVAGTALAVAFALPSLRWHPPALRGPLHPGR